jgi:hypothetical protein
MFSSEQISEKLGAVGKENNGHLVEIIEVWVHPQLNKWDSVICRSARRIGEYKSSTSWQALHSCDEVLSILGPLA